MRNRVVEPWKTKPIPPLPDSDWEKVVSVKFEILYYPDPFLRVFYQTNKKHEEKREPSEWFHLRPGDGRRKGEIEIIASRGGKATTLIEAFKECEFWQHPTEIKYVKIQKQNGNGHYLYVTKTKYVKVKVVGVI